MYHAGELMHALAFTVVRAKEMYLYISSESFLFLER